MERRGARHQQGGSGLVWLLHLSGSGGYGAEVVFWNLMLGVMASLYHINKGVGRPITFKGIVGIYIAYLGIGMVALLLLFAVLYLLRVNVYVVLGIVALLAALLLYGVSYLSRRFGQYGMLKFFARGKVPGSIRFRSRRLFTGLKYAGSKQAVSERRPVW
ncbi:MAG: DUF4133 domain-containing protein [Chitinophagaceae bacterium]|nr:MAG: DUF4133 domain-containing protein [Chitinophagaceae bacterium]